MSNFADESATRRPPAGYSSRSLGEGPRVRALNKSHESARMNGNQMLGKGRILIAGFIAAIALAFVAVPAHAGVDCTQYPNSPGCQGDVGPTTGDSGDDNGTLPTGGNGGGNNNDNLGDLGDGNGNLPFTGYPLTPLVLLILILIGLGLATRIYVAARDRFGSSAIS